ncbi:MAG: hypothetical protein GTN62_02240 [Gemmatimonadales bacterium]|nr:hypothetical protein [Gemmatimonadales bacterium]NIN12381.1 hypothetical protein [Gemmatimonadales bacterium]NIN48919.1 hypothetical protein [Gemmatimonadales bacterium]NIP06383.1 hypothetical protein [Gemmatimonadales bacterium]NIR00756.1 hypothetical protein [Gemmatimonadales bacterium]
MSKSSLESEEQPRQHRANLILFLALILGAFVITELYREEIVGFGSGLLTKVDTGGLYVILFLISAISSTLVPLPVWIYVFTCVALGFDYITCSVVIALGSTLGSASSYALGRYFRHGRFLERRLNEATLQKWQTRSRYALAAVLLFGTISPTPMDLIYAVSGVLRFPALGFVMLVTTGRVVRYVAMGYIFFALV